MEYYCDIQYILPVVSRMYLFAVPILPSDLLSLMPKTQTATSLCNKEHSDILLACIKTELSSCGSYKCATIMILMTMFKILCVIDVRYILVTIPIEVTEVATTEIATTSKILQTGNSYIRK